MTAGQLQVENATLRDQLQTAEADAEAAWRKVDELAAEIERASRVDSAPSKSRPLADRVVRVLFDRGPTTQIEVARIAGIQPSSMPGVVQRLEARGQLVRLGERSMGQGRPSPVLALADQVEAAA